MNGSKIKYFLLTLAVLAMGVSAGCGALGVDPNQPLFAAGSTPGASVTAPAPLASEPEEGETLIETVIVTQVVTEVVREPVEFDPTSDWWDKLNECAPQKNSAGEYLDSECKLEGRSELITVNDVYRLMKDQNGKFYEGTTIMVIEPAIGQDEASPYYRGLGTRWSVDPSECPQGYTCDIQRETIMHAVRRLDQGHGGVVVILHDSLAEVIANLMGLDEVGIRGFWNMYTDAYADAGSVLTETLEIPTEAIGEVFPNWAAEYIAEIYGDGPRTTSFGATGACGPAGPQVDILNPDPPAVTTVTNEEEGVLLYRPWWDPPNRAPSYVEGVDPAKAVRQIQVVLLPGESITGDWNGGPSYLYPPGCTVEDVVANASETGPSWPFMHIDATTELWVEGARPEDATSTGLSDTPEATPTP